MSLDQLAVAGLHSLLPASNPAPVNSESAEKQDDKSNTIPLDPSLNFAVSSIANPAATSTSATTLTAAAAENAFLAAYNRFTVAIAPKPSTGFANLDILVPHSQAGASGQATDQDAPHDLDEDVEMTDPRFADANPQPQHNDTQLSNLLSHTNPPQAQQQTSQHLASLLSHNNPSHHLDEQRSIPPISEPRTANHNFQTPAPLSGQPSVSTPNNASTSIGRRKRHSDERLLDPRKSVVRIKPTEQLAAEALIEQQNPNATRNQLRSLKLRALHAGRIAERELGMSEEEKARRLRLREYVRKKRADEREDKIKAKHDMDENGGQVSADNGGGGGDKAGNLAANINPSFAIQATHDPLLFGLSIASGSTPGLTQSQSIPGNIPDWHDPALHTPQRPVITMSNMPLSAPAATSTVKRKRASEGAPGGSEPRRKSTSRLKTAEQSALEAQIERENPTATKNQLKSLKLRALHAGRIAERERDMSEKEKARRLKLREYMRRRREEERGEGILKPELPVPPAKNSSSSTTELDAADRSAAFSIMGLNNQSFLQHLPTPVTMPTPVSQTNHNLHLHPLFQMPLPSAPTLTSSAITPVVHHYDPSGNTNITSITNSNNSNNSNGNHNFSDVWSTLPMTSSTGAVGGGDVSERQREDELAERALHAAIEEVIGIQEQDQHAALEQERIRIAEEEILGIQRARIADAEMEIIAAAKAEVELASAVASGSGSGSGSGLNGSETKLE